MDRIFIKDLALEMSIGVTPSEHTQRQRVLVSASAFCNVSRVAAQSDRLEDTVPYDALIEHIRNLSQSRHFNLVESFAEEIAEKILANQAVQGVYVCIEKPDVFAGNPASVGIEIQRFKSAQTAGMPF